MPNSEPTKPASDTPAGSSPTPTPRGARQGSLGTSRRGMRRNSRRNQGDGPKNGSTSGSSSGAGNGIGGGAGAGSISARPNDRANSGQGSQQRTHSSKHPQLPSVDEAPIVAISLATSGIHPTTARAVAFSLVFFDGSFTEAESGALEKLELGHEVHSLTKRLNPGEDIGPKHLHGYTPDDLSLAKGFQSSAELLRAALDGRTVILHQAGMTWGFITQEFRRAQRAAARNRRNRGRGRGPRKVDTPQPVRIIDTLGTARRQAVDSMDPRLRSIAQQYGVADNAAVAELHETLMLGIGATASVERGSIPADDLLLADAHLVAHVAAIQINENRHRGSITVLDPSTLMADPFGIQRSEQRVQAARASRRWVNPGVWTRGEKLVQGMEFVISPDVAGDPDELLDKAVAAGLAYSEKLNRRSSVVVCNETFALRGKSMHADRKEIPLISDKEFLELLDDVEQGEREPKPVRPGVGVRPRTSSLTPTGLRPGNQQRPGKGTPNKGSNKTSSRGSNKGSNKGSSKGSPSSNSSNRKNSGNKGGHKPAAKNNIPGPRGATEAKAGGVERHNGRHGDRNNRRRNNNRGRNRNNSANN